MPNTEGRRKGNQSDKEKKKKESILDLSKYIDKTIRVKFQGGREASGVLKGFDPLLNLVLDGTIEYMRGM
uniref:LSM7 homolog, U6 small nuclear RNA and mRNA degradation associated n=1 Tax=Chelonoidis abingdonii TaxID=106734 RepID=A0A8C0GUB6_CHEAB